jgi:hypothetical protein
MKRWHSRISGGNGVDALAVDDAYAFFVCCYHFKDWLKTDDSVSKTIRDDVEGAIGRSVLLSLSADITNGFKHLTRSQPARISADATIKAVVTSLDSVVLGGDPVGTVIVVFDGTAERDMRGIADGCVAAWDTFLTDRGLSIPTDRHGPQGK